MNLIEPGRMPTKSLVKLIRIDVRNGYPRRPRITTIIGATRTYPNSRSCPRYVSPRDLVAARRSRMLRDLVAIHDPFIALSSAGQRLWPAREPRRGRRGSRGLLLEPVLLPDRLGSGVVFVERLVDRPVRLNHARNHEGR